MRAKLAESTGAASFHNATSPLFRQHEDHVFDGGITAFGILPGWTGKGGFPVRIKLVPALRASPASWVGGWGTPGLDRENGDHLLFLTEEFMTKRRRRGDSLSPVVVGARLLGIRDY